MKVSFNPNFYNYKSKNNFKKANESYNNQSNRAFQGKITNPLAILGLSTLVLATACSPKEKKDSLSGKKQANVEVTDNFKTKAEPFSKSLFQMERGANVLINELANSRDYYSSIYAKQIIYPSLSEGKDTPEVLTECAVTIIQSALNSTSEYFENVENPNFNNALKSFHKEIAQILVDGMNDLDPSVIDNYSANIDYIYSSSDIIPPKKASRICSMMEDYANDIMFPESSINGLSAQVRETTNQRINIAIDNFIQESGLDVDKGQLKEIILEQKEKNKDSLENNENILTLIYGLNVFSVICLLLYSLPEQTLPEEEKNKYHRSNRSTDMDI